MLTVKHLTIISNQTAGSAYQSPQHCLLKDISFEVHQGEILGIIGASGSGKSLLANRLLGSLPQGFSSLGEVHISPLASDRSGDNIPYNHRNIALVAQTATVLNPTSMLGRQLARQAANNIDIDQILLKVQLPLAIKTAYPHQLSGGMAKRFLSALAVVQNTPFIVADEPSCGLDETTALALFNYYQQLATQGKGIVAISHDLKLIMAFSSRILVLNQGEIIEETTPETIRLGQCAPYTYSLWLAQPENWDAEFFCSENSTDENSVIKRHHLESQSPTEMAFRELTSC